MTISFYLFFCLFVCFALFCILKKKFHDWTVLDHICHLIFRATQQSFEVDAVHQNRKRRESQAVFNVKYIYLIKKEQYWALDGDQSPETEQTWTSQQTFKKNKAAIVVSFQLQKPSLIFIKTSWKVSIKQTCPGLLI